MNSMPPTKPPRGIKPTKETVNLSAFFHSLLNSYLIFNCTSFAEWFIDLCNSSFVSK